MHASATVTLLVQILVIVAVGQLLALAARRVGQPAVVAQVIAGVALGPSLLGVLWPAGLSALWAPDSLPALNAVGQLGLVLFMFLVGLEFDATLIKGLGRASVFISTSSIAAPFAMGIGLAWPLYVQFAPPGVPFLPFALFLGVAMSITAFPVLARILAERQALRTRIGAIALACAAVNDVTAWCILAFVVAVARVEGAESAVLTVVEAAAYVLVMLTLVRPLLGRIGERTREGASQGLLAVMFLLVFVSAAITELIGIHALFGAFAMGVITPRESGFTRALAEKLEDVVIIVLLPVYFACSGLRTDLTLMASTSAWTVCAAIIVVACVGKFGGSLVAARASGLTWQESSAIGILMNTRGLIQLIVLNIGLDLKVISPELFAMMVVMAIVTTMMTSPALEWVYPRAQIERELAAKGAAEATASKPPAVTPPAVLLCISDPTIGGPMVTFAERFSRGRGKPILALRLLPIEKPSNYLSTATPGEALEGLSSVDERAAELAITVATRSFPSAKPARDICRVADEVGVELILLGSHRPLLQRSMLGGVVADVVARAELPVGVLVDRGLVAVDRVLLAVDDSEDGRAAATVAAQLERGGASVTRWEPAAAPGAADGDRTEGLLAEAERGYDLVVVGMNATWDLDPSPTPWHRERLGQGIATTLLAVRGAS